MGNSGNAGGRTQEFEALQYISSFPFVPVVRAKTVTSDYSGFPAP